MAQHLRLGQLGQPGGKARRIPSGTSASVPTVEASRLGRAEDDAAAAGGAHSITSGSSQTAA